MRKVNYTPQLLEKQKNEMFRLYNDFSIKNNYLPSINFNKFCEHFNFKQKVDKNGNFYIMLTEDIKVIKQDFLDEKYKK